MIVTAAFPQNDILHKLIPLFQERRKTLRKRLDIFLTSGFCRRYGKKILKSAYNRTTQDFVTYSKCKLNAKSTIFSIDEGLGRLVNRWGGIREDSVLRIYESIQDLEGHHGRNRELEMNEALSVQSMKEIGLGEETMGGEDSTALGQVCNVAAGAQDQGGQVACNGMERTLEEPVRLGSQLPSIGIEVMGIEPLNHKENAEAGDPTGSESNVLHQPPTDWLEPLEEDDDTEELDNQMWKVNPLRRGKQVNGKRQTVIKEKKSVLKMNSNGRFRRRRRGTDVDGDWLDWPVLGEGWKRKEVFRRSGFSVGKTDTYYKSPDGERVRSKIEMAKYLARSVDLTMFDYKSGVFLGDRAIRGMKRRKGTSASVTAPSVATEKGTASVITEESAASSGLSLTPEKTGSWDGSCTPPSVLTNTHGQNFSIQKFTPPRVVVPQKAVSPRLMPATRRNGTSPGSPCSPSASPHSVKAASVSLDMPRRRGGSVLSLCLTDIAHQGFSTPSTRSRDVPPLNLPYLNPSLVPLSPTSSPERNYNPALQGQSLMNSPVSNAPSQAPSPLSVPCNSKLPLNGVLPLFDSSESLPRTCIKCGASFHNEEIVEPDGASLCPSCRPKEEQADTQSSIVFRRVGHRERVLGKASRMNEGRAISERPNIGRRKRTDIWINFTFDARRKKTRCKLCSLTLMGKNTTNLKRHLQIFHPEIHSKLKKSPFDRRGPLNEKSCCIPAEYFTSSPKKTRRTPMLLKKQKVLRTNARCLAYSEAKRLKKQYTISHPSEPEGFLLDSDNAESPPDSPQGRSKRHSRRSRRACLKCDACLRTTDCGKCDFCMDKPKFGGSNKKRQKCRLRQCQSQAMRHLLPLQLVQSKRRGWMGRHRKRAGRSKNKLRKTWEDFGMTDDDDSDQDSLGGLAPSMEDKHINDNGADSFGSYASQMAGAMFAPSFIPGFGRLDTEALYISSYPLPVQVPDPLVLPRQACYQGNSGMLEMMKMSDIVARTLDAEQPLPPPGSEAVFNPAELMPDAATGALGLAVGDDVRIVEVDTGEAEVTPVITEIFSLAESSPLDGGVDQELLRLLEALRRAVLPAHWVGVMVTGPRLQLLQCSKLSTMADTVLHIEPDFSYHISVQELPLLLTHRLYEAHPPRLASTSEVTSLLLDLENYSVCQGYPAFEMPHREPVLHMRAAACELLVLQSEERCDKCDVTSLVV
ncbi:methyl-CpG-binding domain protein 1a isoform X2 [Brienomyrus brachyistius]|uniref:methyl-CpG-binding domain protein 1a isoform X2 n=1 Tax=Brienomyrus brachyistius TaxID=42636 RepID=UPI0020B1C0EC|nr:methyl-CpG-binding domain protein 1a isoform X2 [Brienomyrus brachyistius]